MRTTRHVADKLSDLELREAVAVELDGYRAEKVPGYGYLWTKACAPSATCINELPPYELSFAHAIRVVAGILGVSNVSIDHDVPGFFHCIIRMSGRVGGTGGIARGHSETSAMEAMLRAGLSLVREERMRVEKITRNAKPL